MKAKIILEMCYNHEGDMKRAKEMIDDAKKLGVWGVKFQKWDIEGLPESVKRKRRDMSNSFGTTYYKHRKALEFSGTQLKELKRYANKKRLNFVVSAKDINSLEALIKIGVTDIKLPSQRYLDNAMYKRLCNLKINRGIKVYVSTGMHTEREILSSKWVGAADVVMHCVSKYPADVQDVNLAFFNKHKFFNGYSSHETDGDAIPYAVMLGAEYIERHYTLDKSRKGTDNKVSSDYEEMKKIMQKINYVEFVMGVDEKVLSKGEKEIADLYRSF